MTVQRPLFLARLFHVLRLNHAAGNCLRIHFERVLRKQLCPGTHHLMECVLKLRKQEVIDNETWKKLKRAVKYSNACSHGRDISHEFKQRRRNAFQMAKLVSDLARKNVRIEPPKVPRPTLGGCFVLPDGRIATKQYVKAMGWPVDQLRDQANGSEVPA